MKSRIAFYNDSPIIGGHEIMTAHIANSAASNPDYEISFLYSSPALPALLDGAIRPMPLPFHAKSIWPMLGMSAQTQVAYIRQCLREIAPDLCCISQGYIESGVRGVWAARAEKIRAVSYIPFGYSNREIGSRWGRLRDTLTGFLFRAPDAYITISEAQKGLLQRFVTAATPIHVIHNLVDSEHEAPAAPEPCESGAALRIGVVGRVNFQQKNQAVCVEVAKRLLELKQDFHFHIVGDGPDLARLRQLVAQAGLCDSFTFHGWLDKRELPAFITSGIDVLLIPSWYEGVPLILLEALQLAVPFLISRRHFIEDYALGDEFLIEPDSAESIARKLVEVASQPGRQDVRAVRDRILPLHSEERFAANVATVFGNLLQR